MYEPQYILIKLHVNLFLISSPLNIFFLSRVSGGLPWQNILKDADYGKGRLKSIRRVLSGQLRLKLSGRFHVFVYKNSRTQLVKALKTCKKFKACIKMMSSMKYICGYNLSNTILVSPIICTLFFTRVFSRRQKSLFNW